MRRGAWLSITARLIGAVVLAWLTPGCATVHYGPYDDEAGVGYLERAVAADAYFVEYVGPRDRVSVARARGFVRRRCAELAVARGWPRVRLHHGRGGVGSSLYRHREPGRADCIGVAGYRLGLAHCRVRRGRTRYERRADRVYFRAQCLRLGLGAGGPASAPAGGFDPRAELRRSR